MSQITETDLKDIVSPVSVEASRKMQYANQSYIDIHRDQKARGDDWVREVSIRSDNMALRLAIGSAISRIPLVERIQYGFRYSRLAVEAIDSSRTGKVDLRDVDMGKLDRVTDNKRVLFWGAIQAITGKIAVRVMYNPDRNIDVLYEHGLYPDTLVVKISDILRQVDEPGVYKVAGTREKAGSLVKNPTILIKNRGRGERETYQPVLNEPLGFLTEKAAKPIIDGSRLLAAYCLPYFVQVFQENSPLYKK